MNDGNGATRQDYLRTPLNFVQLLVALLTVTGTLLAAGGLAHYYFAGHNAVQRTMCIAHFHLDVASFERAQANAYTRYVKAKTEMLLMENRLALLDKGVMQEKDDKEGTEPMFMTKKTVIREIAIQRDRMETAKGERVQWGDKRKRLEQAFESDTLCPDRGGILWPVSL